MPILKEGKIRTIVIILFCLVLFSFLYSYVLVSYTNEDSNDMFEIFDQTISSSKAYVEIILYVKGVDTKTGEINTLLYFEPHGDITKSDLYELKEPLILEIWGNTGQSQFDMPAEKAMNSLETTINIYENRPKDYPFDKHRAEAWFQIRRAGPSSVIDDVKSYSASIIPIKLKFDETFSGYNIAATQRPDSDPDYTVLDIELSRSWIVVSFSIFIMVIKWLLAIGALMVVFSVLRGRKVELGMFSWLAALLFALPPMRNSMPDVPPIGTLSDFIAFFWVEGIIAISLATLVFIWVIRRFEHNKNEEQEGKATISKKP